MILKRCETCGSEFQAERQRNRFCSKPCQHQGSITKNGYRQIKIDQRRTTEHRAMMERHLGRKLKKSEHVHHRNGDKRDNRLENLEVMTVQEHTRLHRTKHPEWKACECCGVMFRPEVRQRARQKTCSKACRYQLSAATARRRAS